MKKKKLLILDLVVLIIVVSVICLISNLNNKDSLKIKKEYESLNNTVRESDGSKYNNVSISRNNPITYISAKEAVNTIKNKKGIIYFGANWCPWCRNAIEVLIDASKEMKLEKVYYVDMNDVRDVFEVKDGKLTKTVEEKDGYNELLKILDKILEEDKYIVTDDNKQEYDTGEKRIYIPLVVTFNKGKILDSHEGTVELNKKQSKYDKLTIKQEEELSKIYEQMINKIK